MSRTQSICIVGGGVSGLAWAYVLGRLGFSATVFERAPSVGGQWLHAYPRVRLQNTAHEYAFPDFPWPFAPPRHPTAEQILAYVRQSVDAMGLDVRTGQEVVSAERDDAAGKWRVTVRNADGSSAPAVAFDKLVTSIGQYTDGKHRPEFPGEAAFEGDIVTERQVKDLDGAFAQGRRVVVVGFGKSALDMASLAAANGAEVHHVFRRARWTIPQTIFGVHYRYLLFSRANGTFLMPSWDHPTAFERFAHRKARFAVDGFWGALQRVIRLHARRAAWRLGPDAAARVERVLPPAGTSLPYECRSAIALAPRAYCRQVARGEIEPAVAELVGFAAPRSVVLQAEGGEESRINDVDVVVLALGSESPVFPFLPAGVRAQLEAEIDGVQLFRHVLAPDVYPDSLAFAGFNHGFLHLPSAYLGALWTGALWRGDFELPSTETMQACVEKVRAWKREHILFEPSRSCAINTRFQQYNDMICMELGLAPHRKLPNALAEALGNYGAADYDGIVDEYLEVHRCGGPPTIDWDRFAT